MVLIWLWENLRFSKFQGDEHKFDRSVYSIRTLHFQLIVVRVESFQKQDPVSGSSWISMGREAEVEDARSLGKCATFVLQLGNEANPTEGQFAF